MTAPPVASGSRLGGMVVGTDSSRVYHLDANHHVIELGFQNGWHFSDLTLAAQAGPAAPGSPFAVYTMAADLPRVHYLDGSGHVDQLWWDGQDWYFANLSAGTGAVAAPDSPLSGFPMASGQATLYYVGGDRHVHELFWTGLDWQPSDPSSISQVPINVAAGSPLASFVVESGTEPRVYYQGTDGHVHELYSSSHGAWGYVDLNALTGAPAVLPGTGMAGLALNDNLSRVYFVGTDQHVHELWWSGAGWSDNDLSKSTGVYDVSSTTSLTATVVDVSFPHVYYQASAAAGGTVHELAWDGQAWADHDVGLSAGGAPVPDAATPLAGFAVGGAVYPRTYYVRGGEVHELWWSGSAWGHVNVTDTAQ